MNYSEDEIEPESKCLLIFKFLFIISFIIAAKNINSNTSFNISRFIDILPRTNLSLNTPPSSITEIFSSREIYINENNLTNDYIKFIRKINQTEEKIYSQILYPDKEFNEVYGITRKDQYDVIDYYNICNNGTLIDNNIYTTNQKDYPLISIVLPSYNKEKYLLRTLRSIQNQSFKNIEIIIVNDCSNDDSASVFNYLLETDPRIRVFHHLKNMGCWRSRLDGFLYSRGKYVLHFDTGDIFIDNYVLEDIYGYAEKYKLDSVRFSFQWVRDNNVSLDSFRKIFSRDYTKIRYGHVDYIIFIFGFGTIWNRLTRANIFSKGLNLIDGYILNAYKNLLEDVWWNELASIISFSHLTVNRVGYCYFPSFWGEGMLKVGTRRRQENAIREFILFWLFEYEILPKNDNKTSVIKEMQKFINPENKVRGKIVLIDYLKTEYPLYEYFFNTLIKD